MDKKFISQRFWELVENPKLKAYELPTEDKLVMLKETLFMMKAIVVDMGAAAEEEGDEKLNEKCICLFHALGALLHLFLPPEIAEAEEDRLESAFKGEKGLQ